MLSYVNKQRTINDYDFANNKEVKDMEVIELIPKLRQLSHADKLYVMQFLVSELAREQTDLLQPNISYPVWSPYYAFETASTMLRILAETSN